MSNPDIVIQIKTLLQKVDPAQREAVKREVQQAFDSSPVQIKTQIANITKNNQAYKLFRDENDKVNKIITQNTNGLNQQVQTTYELVKGAKQGTEQFQKMSSVVSDNMGKAHEKGLVMNEKFNADRIRMHEQALTMNKRFEEQKASGMDKTHAKALEMNKQIDAQMDSRHAKAISMNEKISSQRDKIHASAITQNEKVNESYKQQSLSQTKALEKLQHFQAMNQKLLSDPKMAGVNRELKDLHTQMSNLDPTSKRFNENLKNLQVQATAAENKTKQFGQTMKEQSKFTSIFGQSLLEAGATQNVLPFYIEICNKNVVNL